MLSGDANEDLGANEITCGGADVASVDAMGDCQTELPYISITAEAWRGFYELGPVFVEIGQKVGRRDVSDAGRMMSAECASMKTDFAVSMAKGAETVQAADGTSVVCHPAQANWGYPGHAGCPTGKDVYSPSFQPYANRTDYKYPTIDVFGMGFVPPGVLFSGLASAKAVKEIVDWNAHQGGLFTVGVPRKPGQMGGICSFVQLGHAYGLLLNDMIDHFLITMFGMAAGGMTPGTWTAAECWTAGGGSSGYAAPSQTLLPTLLKWQLMFEDPFAKALWLGRAIPRTWLAPGAAGKNVSINNSPSSYGRLGYTLVPSSTTEIKASITLGAGFRWPPGGVQLRLRSPGFPRQRLNSVSVGGKALAAFLTLARRW